MKKLLSIVLGALFIIWGGLSFAEAKLDYSIDVEQNFSYMGNFDLNDDGNNPIATRGDAGAAAPFTAATGESSGDSVRWFDTLLAFNGNASVQGWGGNDVIFHLRLVSQFDWLGAQTSSDLNARPTSHGASAGPYITGGNLFALSLNQASVKFEEFAGLPVDLTVGRQNIWFGKGFVLGSRIFGHGPAIYAGGIAPSGSKPHNNTLVTGVNGQVNTAQAGNLPVGTSSGGVLHAPQYADFTGFDAVKLDFDWKQFYLNGGYALVASALSQAVGGHATALVRDVASDNDEDLVFVNAGLKSREMAKYPWNVEAYWLMNTDREPLTDQQVAAAGVGSTTKDQVFTTGGRGDVNFPKAWEGFQNVELFAEYAHQYGVLGAAEPDSVRGRDRKAWAANAGLDVKLSSMYTPSFGFEYVVYSGPGAGSIEDDDGAISVADITDWTAWDPAFRGKHFTMIMDFLDVFYLTDTIGFDATPSTGSIDDGKVDAGFTNRKLYIAKAGFNPWNRVDLGGKAIWGELSEQAATQGTNRNLGAEVDLSFGYKVSNKIRWTVDGGIFFPGDYYENRMPRSTADDGGESNAWIGRTGFKFSI